MAKVKPETAHLQPKPKPVYLKNGYLHLHWTSIGTVRPHWMWMIRQRYIPGMCETDRCIVVKVDVDDAPIPCEHEWNPPRWGTMRCDHCGKYRMFKLVVSEPKDGGQDGGQEPESRPTTRLGDVVGVSERGVSGGVVEGSAVYDEVEWLDDEGEDEV